MFTNVLLVTAHTGNATDGHGALRDQSRDVLMDSHADIKTKNKGGLPGVGAEQETATQSWKTGEGRSDCQASPCGEG